MASGSGGFFSYDFAALILRLATGLTFFYHGAQKMFGWFGGKGWAETVAGFEKMTLMGQYKIPEYLAMAIPITECIGGCCVILGLLTRFWSAGHAIIMIMAIYMVHGPKAWSLRDPNEVAYQLTLLAIALTLFLAGPGRYAITDVEGWVLGVRGGGGKASRGGEE